MAERVENNPSFSSRNERKIPFMLKIGAKVAGAASIAGIAFTASSAEVEETPPPTPSAQEIFGFEIPESIKALGDALSYVRDQESQRENALLVDNEEVSISTLTNSILTMEAPDISVRVRQPETKEQYRAVQKKWTSNLSQLFNRFNICNLNILWSPTTSELNPASKDPYDDLGLNRQVDSQTPGCQDQE